MLAMDAHTHLDMEAFAHDLDEVVARATSVGVVGWVIAGAAPNDWGRVLQIAKHSGGAAILGIHPWWSSLSEEELADTLQSLAAQLTQHGLGELGLDRLHAEDESAWRQQHDVFEAQLTLAVSRDLPVVLHCVKAWPALRRVIERVGLPRSGGMLHGWTGPVAHAREAVGLGLHVSFGPSVLRSRRAAESLGAVPLHRLLVETDCPDRPVGGAPRGEPAHLWRVIEAVAARQGHTVQTVAQHTYENTQRLFRYCSPVR